MRRGAKRNLKMLRAHGGIELFPRLIVRGVLPPIVGEPTLGQAAIDLGKGLPQRMIFRTGTIDILNGCPRQPVELGIVPRGQRLLVLQFIELAMQTCEGGMQTLSTCKVIDLQGQIFQGLDLEHALQKELMWAGRVLFQLARTPTPLCAEVASQSVPRRLAGAQTFPQAKTGLFARLAVSNRPASTLSAVRGVAASETSKALRPSRAWLTASTRCSAGLKGRSPVGTGLRSGISAACAVEAEQGLHFGQIRARQQRMRFLVQARIAQIEPCAWLA